MYLDDRLLIDTTDHPFDEDGTPKQLRRGA